MPKRAVKPKAETPAQRRDRLRRERYKFVKGQNEIDLMNNLNQRLALTSLTNIKNGFIADTGTLKPESLARRLRLLYKGNNLAKLVIYTRKRNNKLELGIASFQGLKNKRLQEEFKEENNSPWNFALVNAIIDSAYETGYNRVLLRDITTTEAYKLQPNINKRNAMHDLYEGTRKACNFNKKTWIGGVRYWYREFP